MASLLPTPSGSGGTRDPNSLLTNALARANAAGADTKGAEKGGSFLQQAKRVGGGGLLTALDWLGRPSQAVLRGIQGQQTGSGILRGVGQGFTGSTDGFRWRSEDTTNLRGALNTDNFQRAGGRDRAEAETDAERQGGRLAGAVDFVGTAALDPTSYLTAGTGKAATVGAKVAAEQLVKHGAPDIAQKVTENAGKRALKSVLSEDEMGVLRTAIKSSDEASIAKGGAEKFADRAIKELNSPAGLKVAGLNVLPAETLRPAAEAARLVGKTDESGNLINRGLSNVVGDSRIVEAAGRALKPRYELARQYGQDVADKVGALGRQSGAEEALATKEAITRLNKVVKESGVTDDELRSVFTPARDNGTLLKLADDYAKQGDEGRAALARELDDTTKLNAHGPITVKGGKIYADSAPAPKDQQDLFGLGGEAADASSTGAKQAAKALGPAAPKATGAPRVIGTRGDKVVGANVRQESLFGEAAQLTAELTPQGRRAVLDRTADLSRRLNVPAADISAIVRTGKLPTGVTREDFESAAKAATKSTKEMIEKNTLKASARATQRQFADEARDKLFRGLADIKDGSGSSLLSSTAKNGYEAIKMSDGSTAYVPSEIKKEFSRVEAIINNDESIRAFERQIDNWQKWWRATATVPVIGGFGFHMRNAQGNIFNNFLAGVKDPSVYTQAGKLQTAIEKASNSDKPFAEALRASNLTEREIKIVEEARKRGTIGDFLIQADQEIDPLVRDTSRAKSVAKGLNPLDRQNSYAIRSGTYIGRQVETNARLAHFIDVVNKTGSFERADESVRKYLFDYADLTPIEQKTFRRYVPFYTYMRKNSPLQLEKLFTQPGKYSAIANFYNQAALNAPDTGDKDIPSYLLESGAVPITGGDNPMMLSVDTPFSAALRVAQPAVNVAGLIGGDKNPFRPSGGKGEAARSVVNQFGGGPVELAKFALTQATGKDLFTGADISKESDGATANRLAKALSPLYGKAASIQKDATSDNKGDKISRVMDAISGANATAVTDKRSQGEQYRKLDIVSGAIAAAKADGVDIPTTSELQKAGVLPRPAKKPKKPSVKKVRAKKVKTKKPTVKKARVVKPKKPPTA